MKQLKVGLVGASANGSGWGAAAHIPAIKAADGVELEAVCTSSVASAKASARAHNAPNAYHNINDLVKNPKIDLISCAINIPAHYNVVKTALLAGKNVYCEWPLGATLKETEELTALAKKQNVKTIIGLQGRVCPELKYIKDLFEKGWFGEIISIKITAQSKGSNVRKSKQAWENEQRKKATLFNIVGGHNLDYLQYCFGDISELFARITTRFKTLTFADSNEVVQNSTPDHVLVNGVLENSALFTLELTSVANHAAGWQLEVFGTKGTLKATTPVMPQISPVNIETSIGEGPFNKVSVPNEIEFEGPGKNVALLYREFLNASSKDNFQIPDFDSAMKIHRLLDVIEESNKTGKKIEIKTAR